MAGSDPIAQNNQIQFDAPEQALPIAHQINQARTYFKESMFEGRCYCPLQYLGFHLLNIVSVITNAVSALVSLLIGAFTACCRGREAFSPFIGSMRELGTSLATLPLIFEARILIGQCVPSVLPLGADNGSLYRVDDDEDVLYS